MFLKRWAIVAPGLGILLVGAHYWKARSESRIPPKHLDSPAVASRPEPSHELRVSGTVAALRSASLLAPRILGSRTGLNRGGDAAFSSSSGTATGGGGGGGADFNLVLLHLARAGTHVKAGEVVAQFDPQNQLQRLDDYKDTVVQLENNIHSMEATLAATKEAHEQAVRTAKSAWQQAVLDLQVAPVQSQIDVEKGKLAVEEARTTYDQLVAETPLIEESQRAQMRIADLNCGQARIELQRAQANVDRMTVKSPIDGIVVMASIVRNGEYGQIREGDQVNAGQPFVTIVDPSSMVLSAVVNQVDAQKLKLGMNATVFVDAFPEIHLPGTLVGIGAMARPSSFRETYVGEIPVRIRIEGTAPKLIPDLTGSAEIDLPAAH